MENFPLDIVGLNQALRAWEYIYNTICPHQAGLSHPTTISAKMPAGKGESVTNHLNEYRNLTFAELSLNILFR